jgi:hypothetical protein
MPVAVREMHDGPKQVNDGGYKPPEVT